MRIRKNGKVVNLTESDLQRIVKRVMSEQNNNPLKLQLWKDEGNKNFFMNVEIPIDSIKPSPSGAKFDVIFKYGGTREDQIASGSYKCYSNKIILSNPKDEQLRGSDKYLTPKGVEELNKYTKCGDYASRATDAADDMV